MRVGCAGSSLLSSHVVLFLASIQVKSASSWAPIVGQWVWILVNDESCSFCCNVVLGVLFQRKTMVVITKIGCSKSGPEKGRLVSLVLRLTAPLSSELAVSSGYPRFPASAT